MPFSFWAKAFRATVFFRARSSTLQIRPEIVKMHIALLNKNMCILCNAMKNNEYFMR
jgi:hypothetical protein